MRQFTRQHLRVDSENNLHLLGGRLELICVEANGKRSFVVARQWISHVAGNYVIFTQ